MYARQFLAPNPVDVDADGLYRHGFFKQAADFYSLQASKLPADQAWPLRVNAIMANLRREDNPRAGLIEARNILDYFLKGTPEYAHYDVQFAEAWVLMATGSYERAKERVDGLRRIATTVRDFGRIQTIRSHIAWLEGSEKLAHELFDDAASKLRDKDSRDERLDNLVYNLGYLSWANRFVMVWRGFILAMQTKRSHDGKRLLSYIVTPRRLQ